MFKSPTFYNWMLLNGNFRNTSEPIVRVDSRGLMYGDGCFETMWYSGTGIVGLQHHLDRLRGGLQYLGIRVPEICKKEAFVSGFRLLLQKNRLAGKQAVIRVQVWREQGRGYATDGMERFSWALRVLEPLAQKSAVRLCVADTRRIPSEAVHPGYKFTNGINYIRAAQEAQSKNVDDALMLTMDGFVSETTIANIFWEKNGEWFTPDTTCDLLPGITRKYTLQWLKSSDITVHTGKFRPEELDDADGIFVTNSIKGLQSVSHIGSKKFDISVRYRASFRKWLQQQEDAI